MTNLSSAAQAVLDAYCFNPNRVNSDWANLADALRAVAGQVIPVIETPYGTTLTPILKPMEIKDKLNAIANEIERHGL